MLEEELHEFGGCEVFGFELVDLEPKVPNVDAFELVPVNDALLRHHFCLAQATRKVTHFLFIINY